MLHCKNLARTNQSFCGRKMEQNTKGNEGFFGRKEEQNMKITEGCEEGKKSQTLKDLDTQQSVGLLIRANEFTAN